ncbi:MULTISPECIES: SAM-dependent methyltransferase [Paenibacillus]|uniref:SAM-dependent methyltransferase n=1 Tax=Paenibacillus TaxID=44249 RepID=UPI0022B92A25|nr:SAM-dependent methyltransferase [Paenibacillus caseinilyticus]MCZ8522682.1 tetratricopeptide repeat protein [Paenibacillus caseinilyticus]
MIHNEKKAYRFSESPLWELQRAYYEEQGIEAWQKEEVPYYITNNPMIATAYAEVLFGFLQDRAAAGRSAEPVTFLELGAGPGRLACHILRELCALIDYAGMPLPPFRYVLSDLAAKNLAYWKEHPALRTYTEQGLLDFAVFDAVHDEVLHLAVSGDRVRPGNLKQPLLLIANYFFDSIPQDLLYVDDGKVYECRVSLGLPEEAAGGSASEQLRQLAPEYSYHGTEEYERESYPYRHVIEHYKESLADTHILFPALGLRCLERLGRLSQEGFVLLTADKGDHRLANWEFAEAPQPVVHGSFSLTANYHAIGQVYEGRGAQVLFTDSHYNNLNIGCILHLPDPAAHVQTRLAYRRFVDRYGPDDYFTLKEGMDARREAMGLDEFLSFWKLGGYDTEWFVGSAGHLAGLLTGCGDDAAEDLRLGIARMWEGSYLLRGRSRLAADCAMLLFRMDRFEEALDYYEEALLGAEGASEAPDIGILYDMAVSYYETGQDEKAKEWARRAAAADPEHEGTLSLLQLLAES